MTNVALALTKAPEIATLLSKIVIMGLTTSDPAFMGRLPRWSTPISLMIPRPRISALQAVADVTLVGMDVTMTTLFTTAMMEEVAREGDDAAKELMRMTEFYVGAYKTMYPGIEGCGLHDPLAVAIAEDPSLATTDRIFVDEELHGELTRGQTVADLRASPSRCAMRRFA